MSGPYDDIIDLPHSVSTKHPQMSAMARAAQFSPFAALTGHDAAIKETARLTDEKPELDEHRIAVLDERLQMIARQLSARPMVCITYFQPDEKKNGGTYAVAVGAVKRIVAGARMIEMEDQTRIAMEQILEISGELFAE